MYHASDFGFSIEGQLPGPSEDRTVAQGDLCDEYVSWCRGKAYPDNLSADELVVELSYRSPLPPIEDFRWLSNFIDRWDRAVAI